jgi:hypothetical protein
VCGALVDIDNGVLLNLLEDNKLTTMQKAIKNNPIICVTRDTNFKISSAFRIMLLPTSQLLSRQNVKLISVLMAVAIFSFCRFP